MIRSIFRTLRGILHWPELYGALDPASSQIRCFRLQPGDFDNPITGESFIVSLDEDPTYEALSYVWGKDVAPNPILANGTELSITVNLDSALRHIRLKDRPRVLWIDAICINQDDLCERSQQVQLMSRIFTTAYTVVIWLGPGTNDSDIAMECIRAMDRESWDSYDFCFRVRDILRREFFTRVWVVQEFMLAREAEFVYGTFSVDRDTFMNMWFHLYSDVSDGFHRRWMRDYDLRAEKASEPHAMFTKTDLLKQLSPYIEYRSIAQVFLTFQEHFSRIEQYCDKPRAVAELVKQRLPDEPGANLLVEALAGGVNRASRLAARVMATRKEFHSDQCIRVWDDTRRLLFLWSSPAQYWKDNFAQRHGSSGQHPRRFLREAILVTNNLSYSDLKDRIYGVFGLVTESLSMIPIDYEQTTTDLCIRTMEYLIMKERWGLFDAQKYWYAHKLLPGLPSWVINFTAECTEWDRVTMDGDPTEVLEFCSSCSGLCGVRLQNFTVTKAVPILLCSGLHLGKITHQSKLLFDHHDGDAIKDFFEADTIATGLNGSIKEMLRDCPFKNQAIISVWYKCVLAAQGNAMPDLDPLEMEVVSRRWFLHHRVIITDRGLVAFSTEEAKVGDEVSLLPGLNVAAVLRPVEQVRKSALSDTYPPLPFKSHEIVGFANSPCPHKDELEAIKKAGSKSWKNHTCFQGKEMVVFHIV